MMLLRVYVLRKIIGVRRALGSEAVSKKNLRERTETCSRLDFVLVVTDS